MNDTVVVVSGHIVYGFFYAVVFRNIVRFIYSVAGFFDGNAHRVIPCGGIESGVIFVVCVPLLYIEIFDEVIGEFF